MRAFVLALALVSISACRKPQDGSAVLTSAKQDAPIRVQTTAVVERTMPEYLTLTGTLKASQESEVAADASGKVTATFVERGQHVNAGDTLAILDARGASLTATALGAQSKLAQAQLDQAQKECARVQQLLRSGAISQAEYDRTSSQCQTNQWAAAAAQAQQQSAQKLVGDAVIRAPFSGVVGERFVSVGQYVQPQTKVVSLYAPDPLRLELTVPEANVAAVKQDMPVLFTVATYGGEKFQGNVRFISPNVRPSTRDLVVEAVCPNADGKLRSGMFAVAQLQVAEAPHAAVPVTAVKSEDIQSPRVFVVTPDKHVQERVVQLGGEKDALVAVLVGLAVGDNVVDKPGPDVHDGVSVQ